MFEILLVAILAPVAPTMAHSYNRKLHLRTGEYFLFLRVFGVDSQDVDRSDSSVVKR